MPIMTPKLEATDAILLCLPSSFNPWKRPPSTLTASSLLSFCTSSKIACEIAKRPKTTTIKLNKHIESMALNKVNIEFLRKQMDKVLVDIEKLKDANREMKYTNGSHQ